MWLIENQTDKVEKLAILGQAKKIPYVLYVCMCIYDLLSKSVYK